MYKAQHPEFELWSQGVHARSGVSCADCHMPYERQGAMKVSSHWVRSPLLNINNACQTCHNVPEDELRDKVDTIQARTKSQIERAATAMTDMLDAILEAKAAGATPSSSRRSSNCRGRRCGGSISSAAKTRMVSTPIRKPCEFWANRSTTAARRRRPHCALGRRRRQRSNRQGKPIEGVTPTDKAAAWC